MKISRTTKIFQIQIINKSTTPYLIQTFTNNSSRCRTIDQIASSSDGFKLEISKQPNIQKHATCPFIESPLHSFNDPILLWSLTNCMISNDSSILAEFIKATTIKFHDII